MNDEAAKLMSEMSAAILQQLMVSGLNAHQGMMVLAKTATTGFYVDGLTREEAVDRFKDVVNLTYDAIEEAMARRVQ